jgi:hypothetical protein
VLQVAIHSFAHINPWWHYVLGEHSRGDACDFPGRCRRAIALTVADRGTRVPWERGVANA